MSRDEIVKNDYNISPSRYIHTGEGEEYRPIAEIVDELDALETDICNTNNELVKIYSLLGIKP